jgi:hypothetical protein
MKCVYQMFILFFFITSSCSFSALFFVVKQFEIIIMDKIMQGSRNSTHNISMQTVCPLKKSWKLSGLSLSSFKPVYASI